MISILMATYSGHKYIKRSLDSILNQTYENFEILIGLNGENTETKKILEGYNDPRIRIFDYMGDKGKVKTLNKLLKESKYEIIGIQDDDDIWVGTKLETQIPLFKDFDVVGTFIQYINENEGRSEWGNGPSLSIDHQDITKGIQSGDNQIANTSALFRKSDALLIGGWKEEFEGIEDYDFWARLMKSGKQFINIPEVLVLHRIHRTSNFNFNNYDKSRLMGS